jgi:hypothetical protein
MALLQLRLADAFGRPLAFRVHEALVLELEVCGCTLQSKDECPVLSCDWTPIGPGDSQAPNFPA